jgi:hypothetical protein
MRIRVIHKPTEPCIDGIQLDRFVPGTQYEVGNSLGALFLAEGWAEPVGSDDPAMLIPMREFEADHPSEGPANLRREFFPPYYDGAPVVMAADRRRRKRVPRRL